MSKYKVNKTEDEWRNQLTEDEFKILRQKGTEKPFTGLYNTHFKEGNYHCKACNELLFDSESKFNSHCGWPSFDASVKHKIEYKLDKTFGMLRTEILCNTCGSHLGHVFNDGPTKTGTRYCVNSLSINFKETS